MSIRNCSVWCCLSPIVLAYKIHCCWHCPGPSLNHTNASNQPTCPSGTVLRKPLAHVHWSQALGPAVVAWSHLRGPATVGAVVSAQTPAPPLRAGARKPCSCERQVRPSHGNNSNGLGCSAGAGLTQPQGVARVNRWILEPLCSDFSPAS